MWVLRTLGLTSEQNCPLSHNPQAVAPRAPLPVGMGEATELALFPPSQEEEPRADPQHKSKPNMERIRAPRP